MLLFSLKPIKISGVQQKLEVSTELVKQVYSFSILFFSTKQSSLVQFFFIVRNPRLFVVYSWGTKDDIKLPHVRPQWLN